MYKKRSVLFWIISLLILPSVRASELDVELVINYILGTSVYTNLALLRFGLCVVSFLLIFYASMKIFRGNTFLSVALALVISILGIRFIPESLILSSWNWFGIVIFILIILAPYLLIMGMIENRFLRYTFLILSY